MTLPKLRDAQCRDCPDKLVRVEFAHEQLGASVEDVEFAFLLDSLQRGGHPFGPDDLTIGERLQIAAIDQEREAHRWRTMSRSGSAFATSPPPALPPSSDD